MTSAAHLSFRRTCCRLYSVAEPGFEKGLLWNSSNSACSSSLVVWCTFYCIVPILHGSKPQCPSKPPTKTFKQDYNKVAFSSQKWHLRFWCSDPLPYAFAATSHSQTGQSSHPNKSQPWLVLGHAATFGFAPSPLCARTPAKKMLAKTKKQSTAKEEMRSKHQERTQLCSESTKWTRHGAQVWWFVQACGRVQWHPVAYR